MRSVVCPQFLQFSNKRLVHPFAMVRFILALRLLSLAAVLQMRYPKLAQVGSGT